MTKNKITTIDFHHPKGNCLPGSLLSRLTDAITQAASDKNSVVIVLQSTGEGAFCAGASFDELLSINDFEESKQFFMGFAHVINAMRTCPKFIITRVQGKAIGGGVGIIAASDYAFANPSASIRLSEISMGIGPFVVGPAVRHKIGTSSLSTLALDARSWYSAKWAMSKGLYSKVISPNEELDKAVSQLAEELASSNPEAMKELKEILWQGTGHWESTLDQRAEISGRLALSDFTKEYIEEFKKK
ncbi:MAG: enoyl-CoA hydratase/isomerase family protein [Balneolaceae bacterium]